MAIDYDTGYYVTRTARAFMRVADARVRPLGLGVAHLPVLVCLAEDGPLTQTEIARRVHVEQPTAALLLQRMAKAGLIDRSPDPHDGRATLVTLSDHARGLLPDALALLTAANEAATADLSDAEVVVLRDLLGRVLVNLTTTIDGGLG